MQQVKELTLFFVTVGLDMSAAAAADMTDPLRGLLTTVCNHVGYEVLDRMSNEQLASFLRDLHPFANAIAASGGSQETTGDVSYDFQSLAHDIKEARESLNDVLKVPIIEQRTQEWFDIRDNLLTASSLAQALGKGKFGTRRQLLNEKITKDKTFNGSPATEWGTMFEDMVMRCYLQKLIYRPPIHNFGLIPHPDIKCFGASPDGITAWGVMVEIKAPYKRQIEYGTVPPHYYLQIQGQLSACRLKHCDYVEGIMAVYGTMTEYCEAHKNDRKFHGVIIEYKQVEGINVIEKNRYIYSPEGLTGIEANEWALREVSRLSNPNEYMFVKMKPWHMVDLNIVSVRFDPKEWNDIAPRIQAFWDEVTEGRQLLASGGTLETKAKKTRKPSKPRARSTHTYDSSAYKKSKYEFVDDD